MYNEIEDCLEKLDVVSYKLGLTLGEKLWENLTLNPPTNLWDLMSRVKMFNWLEDDVRQAERATRSSSQGDGSFKKQRESLADYESCRASTWFLKNRSTSSSNESETSRILRSLFPWEEIPGNAINAENAPFTRKKGIESKIAKPWRFF